MVILNKLVVEINGICYTHRQINVPVYFLDTSGNQVYLLDSQANQCPSIFVRHR